MLAAKDQDVARPLKVLVPLIKEELAAGDAAAMEHYRRAGEMLLEAKAQVPHGKWGHWILNNFKLSQTTATIYMNLARKENYSSTKNFTSLGDFVRQTSNPNYNKHHTTSAYRESMVDAIVKDTLARNAEAKLTRELGLKLIDTGYKVLATKLHPDKGGTTEGMERLNRVRNQLKKFV